MLRPSTWQHLRIPFSYFLFPVFLFALVLAPQIRFGETLWAFLAIHLFLYPASNGYNSYYDKDEGSIGGVEKPMPVTTQLYVVSLVFDALALLLGALVGWYFVVGLLVYGFISKAYSHPAIRLKKYAYASWLIVGGFQGAFMFYVSYQAISGVALGALLAPEVLFGGLLTSLMLWASYPMTQIFQHEEDAQRGDRTLSLRLGIVGTFWFCLVGFGLVGLFFGLYFYKYGGLAALGAFVAFQLPTTVFFNRWFAQVRHNPQAANFKNAMRLNLLSSTFMLLFFLSLGLFDLLKV